MNYNQLKNTPLFLIAGPCVIESEMITNTIAETLVNITDELEIPFIFKASFKKANRTNISSFTSIGITESIDILRNIKKKYNCSILTDVHSIEDIALVADFVDIIQIPAFLCRQTDLILAAAATNKIVNIKKGQFADMDMMAKAIAKVQSVGNNQVMLTERGSFFGYHDLVVDFRNIVKMTALDCIPIIDATHSVQQPNANLGSSGGNPKYVDMIAKCGIIAGANGVFIETHPNPSEALSDAGSMLPLNEMSNLLIDLKHVSAIQ
ncbi:MAG: 3-deoxy-8-phosphooctulonate synthase [Chitinophagales bacterium]|nr:3-deoxy-8-phosphooctulonate synthase [Chitinophagales bacterium]